MLGSFEEGMLRLKELHRFPNVQLLRDGHLRWDVVGLLDQIRTGLASSVETAGGPPDSVGVDTWGVDFALLDESGGLMGLPVTYRDPRTEGRMESFLRRVDARSVYRRTGVQFLRINTLYQLCALAGESPGVLEAADRLLMIPDYFHYRMTGRKTMELTNASTTQMVSVRRPVWDSGLLASVPVPESLFSTPVAPGTRIGPVDASSLDLPGLEGSVVIAPATHDTASAVAAAPASGDGWAFISSGTWCLMGMEMSEPVLSEEARRLNFTNERGVEGRFCFLKNLTGLWMLQGLRDWLPGLPSYAEMEKMAQSAEPFGRFVDPDHSLFFRPSSMAGAIDEYCRRTGQSPPDRAGGYVRCALESMALSFARTLEHLRRVQPGGIDRVHMVGGGCRSPLLCRVACDAMQLPLVCGPVEAAAVGSLLVQAVSLGGLPDLASARRLAYSSLEVREYEPREGQRWEEAARRFQELTEEGSGIEG
jgi:sugar (pentulose or hexulose) kinase